MAKRVCIYLLAVLFLGSVAHVNATPMDDRQKDRWEDFRESWDNRIEMLKEHQEKKGFKSTSSFKKDNKVKREKALAAFKKIMETVEAIIAKYVDGKNERLNGKNLVRIGHNWKRNLEGTDQISGSGTAGMHAPEPSTILLLGLGLIGLAGWGRKRIKKK